MKFYLVGIDFIPMVLVLKIDLDTEISLYVCMYVCMYGLKMKFLCSMVQKL